MLLRPDGTALLFVHALIRGGAYASLLQPRRRNLHARAATYYSGRDPVLYAKHLDHAADPRAPIAYLAAADEQVRAYRHETARALLERGLTLAAASHDRFGLACRLGDVLHELGTPDEAAVAYGQALDSAGDDAQRCRAQVGLAGCMRMLDRYEDAFAHLDQVQAIAIRDRHELLLARVHHLRGNLRFPLDEIAACRAEHAHALRHAKRAGSTELEARALGGLADAEYMRGRMRSACRRFRRCVELARSRGLVRIEVANLPMVGHCLIYSCAFDDALEAGRAGLDLAAMVGHLRAEIIIQNLIADVGQCRGDVDTIEGAVARSLPLARRLGARRFEAHALQHRAEALRLRGRREEAEILLTKALAMCRESGFHFVGPWALAQLAKTTRDPARRVAALAECEAELARGSVGHNHLWAHRNCIEASLEVEAWGEAERYAQALEDYTRAEPLAWSDIWIGWARALAAWGRGTRKPDARARLVAVRDRAAELGMDAAVHGLDQALARS